MLIPFTVNKKLLVLYQPFLGTFNHKRKTFAEHLEQWDKIIPKRLRELCIESIADNWSIQPLFKEIPQLADRLLLLGILATNLPLEITVPIIHEDVYWKRCYEERWPKQLPRNVTEDIAFPMDSSTTSSRSETVDSSNTNHSESALQNNDLSSGIKTKTWKHYYLEMHLKEFLEYLRPEEYEPEAVKLLSSICAPYVSALNISQLQSSYEGSEHIPLGAIIGGLYNLCELSITFQQTYINDSFGWNIFKTSFTDIQHLCKAFEKTINLKTLKVARSDVDCEKFAILLRSPLLKNNSLKEIDFCSCNISNVGVQILCGVLIGNAVIEKITLANNKIGSDGAKALSQLVSRRDIPLKYLNLRLNHIGSKGGKFLLQSLAAPFLNLQHLILAGCAIKCIKIELNDMLLKNNNLRHFDLSNNRFKEDVEKGILMGLEQNIALINFDLRMCNLSSETKHAVMVLLERNRKITKQVKSIHIDI